VLEHARSPADASDAARVNETVARLVARALERHFVPFSSSVIQTPNTFVISFPQYAHLFLI
jgi:hypothetical protein